MYSPSIISPFLNVTLRNIIVQNNYIIFKKHSQYLYKYNKAVSFFISVKRSFFRSGVYIEKLP